MDIRFHAAMTRADVEMAEHALRSLRFHLHRQRNRIDHIEVKLGNADGRNPHHDSYCIVRVKLHGAPSATVVDMSANVLGAIERATDRVCRLTEAQWRLAGNAPATRVVALAA